MAKSTEEELAELEAAVEAVERPIEADDAEAPDGDG